MYSLGVGISKYLGNTIDWQIYIIGQVWVTFLQIASHFLYEYYLGEPDGTKSNALSMFKDNNEREKERTYKTIILILAATSLAVTASVTVYLMRIANINATIVLLMGLSFIGAFFYSAPPLRLENSGYGELISSIIMANFLPAFAFLLQTGNLHRLCAMSTFSMTTLLLAAQLADKLPNYGSDVKYNKRNLIVRLGWKNGMLLHNSLILFAYLLLGIAVAYGLPILIAVPPFLTLPFGLLQIWQMRRVAMGMKPNWKSLTLTPKLIFIGFTYLLTFSFWIR